MTVPANQVLVRKFFYLEKETLIDNCTACMFNEFRFCKMGSTRTALFFAFYSDDKSRKYFMSLGISSVKSENACKPRSQRSPQRQMAGGLVRKAAIVICGFANWHFL